jgi:nucleotide-binding universal stress UspA family protein
MVVAASRSSKHRLDSPKLIDLVVPLDGSRLSESSLPYVEVIAKSLNLGVRLMNVITPVGLSAQNPVDESSYFFGNKIVPDLYKEYENYLAQTADSLTEKGLNVLSQNVLIGNTASALIGCVKDPSESLFVMSTHGRNGIDRLLIGSVTDSVLRSYGGPVFVIPANATLASVHA